jgi:flagellin
MRINNNLMAMNTHRQLGVATNGGAKSMEKLSSGMRINKAGDDAAGLSISEKMRGQIRGLNQASSNSQDGISMIQTAEGALNETHAILQRMRELTVQANNGTNIKEDREKIQQEIKELSEEITSIGDKTQFNKQNLLDGSLGATTDNVGISIDGSVGSVFKIADVTGAKIDAGYIITSDDGTDNTITLSNADGSLTQTITVTDVTAMTVGDKLHFEKFGVTIEATANDVSSLAATNTFDVDANGVSFQVGANGSQSLSLSIDDLRADKLGSGTLKMDAIDVTDFTVAGMSFENQIAAIDDAISKVSEQRSNLGSKQNRLEHTIKNLDTSAENLQAAESRIRDVDMAKEMMEQTKNNILSQASTAMLAQANRSPEGVLQLLR